MYANRRNSLALKEIGVEEHDGDVRFFTGSGNTARAWESFVSSDPLPPKIARENVLNRQ